MRPTASILVFSIVKQCIVVPYVNPTNHATGVQTGLIPRGHLLLLTHYKRNEKSFQDSETRNSIAQVSGLGSGQIKKISVFLVTGRHTYFFLIIIFLEKI